MKFVRMDIFTVIAVVFIAVVLVGEVTAYYRYLP